MAPHEPEPAQRAPKAQEPAQPTEPHPALKPAQRPEPEQAPEPGQPSPPEADRETDQPPEPEQPSRLEADRETEEPAEPEQAAGPELPAKAGAAGRGPEPSPTAALEWERVPGAERAEAEPAASRRFGRGVWLMFIAAALLGLAVGVALVLRGRSLGPSPTAETAGRPTFVIGAAVSPIPSQSPSPAARAAATTTEYVVQPGDTLRSIAQTVYGDADQWPRLYSANRDTIGADPDSLQAGMRLQIP